MRWAADGLRFDRQARTRRCGLMTTFSEIPTGLLHTAIVLLAFRFGISWNPEVLVSNPFIYGDGVDEAFGSNGT